MDRSKRDFFRRSAAALASTLLAPIVGRARTAQSEAPLTNWAGNYRYGTSRIDEVTSVAQAQDLVRRLDHLKVLGTRHCFNGIADSTDHLISLRPMHQAGGMEPAARTVTVDAGMSYGQLCPVLDARGLALHNLASLPHISVAGACATGTHGSGVGNGNLSTAVSAMEMITAAGDVVMFSREKDPDVFPGMVVHLGALGVVTHLTLDVQPAYAMRQDVYLDLPMADVAAHFEDVMSAGYSVSLFTDWQRGRMTEVWIKRRVAAGDARPAEPRFYGATLATKNVHPIAELSAENCTEQLGVPGRWYERLPHFRMGFTPSSGKELQSEYFVPRTHAVDAILAVERLRDRVSPHLLITELRTIAADELWMSPCYRRPSLAIHFTWKPEWDAVREVLPLIERELAPYAARPHWGKLFTLTPAVLRSRYERCEDFKALVARFDPRAKFRNAFLSTNLYG